MAARLEEIEKIRAFSEAQAESDRKILMNMASQFVYDLDEKPLGGVTPDGKAFALRLYWINYWNDATAARLRFPDETLDAPLQGLYEQVPGGWLVRLTAQPTDLDKSEDRERLQWAYERFAVSADH